MFPLVMPYIVLRVFMQLPLIIFIPLYPIFGLIIASYVLNFSLIQLFDEFK